MGLIQHLFIKYLRNRISKINRSPIIIYGNQKSGSTAIARLLAEATNKSVSVDVPYFWEPFQRQVFEGGVSLKEVVNMSRYEFSKDIIKENCLTFLYDKMKIEFPNARNIFIVRNPFENIRSILNRLKIPGDLNEIPEDLLLNANDTWKTVLDNNWLGLKSNHYIESMALRWNKASSIYLENKNDFLLVNYDQFNSSKAQYIYSMAGQLGLPIKKRIEDIVDVPYNLVGDRKNTGIDFFGQKNYDIIQSVCGPTMKLFGF